MANLGDPQVRIQFLINKDTPHGRFNDALYFSKDEYAALTNAEVNDMAAARKDTWVQAVKDAAKAVRIAERKIDMQARAQRLTDQLEALQAEISVTPDDPVVP